METTTNNLDDLDQIDDLIDTQDLSDKRLKKFKKLYKGIEKARQSLSKINLEWLSTFADVKELREAQNALQDLDLRDLKDIPIQEIFNTPNVVTLWRTTEKSENPQERDKSEYEIERVYDSEEDIVYVKCECMDWQVNREKGERCKHIKKVFRREFDEQNVPKDAEFIETKIID